MPLGFVNEVADDGGLTNASLAADQDERTVIGDGIIEEFPQLGTLRVATVDQWTLSTTSGSPGVDLT